MSLLEKTMNTKSNTSGSKPEAPDSAGSFLGHLWASIAFTATLGIICCAIYPAIVWGLAQAIFPGRANGSLVKADGTMTTKDEEAVGSSLIGQSFSQPQYFHSRPSAAGSGYDPTSSGGSNLGPLSAKLMCGTTQLSAFTIFAHDKTHDVAAIPGRVEGTVAAVNATTITVLTPQSVAAPATQPAQTKTTYALDPKLAPPNTVISYHGRTIQATTLTAGENIELMLNDKKAVTAINVIDQENDGAINAVSPGTSTATLTMADTGSTVINVPATAVIVVNGNAAAKLSDVTLDMSVHVTVSMLENYDGIADRVVHYCEDNNITYQSSIPISTFKDQDGIDDVNLITAFNAASGTGPTITPAQPIPGDAVTASGSGLDPHISPENAAIQAQRVADARHVPVDTVKALIEQKTDQPSLGFLGDPGVNVLMLNLALDAAYPVPAPPATAPTTQPAK
jgi:K+-transporting ATPase c subunit